MITLLLTACFEPTPLQLGEAPEVPQTVADAPELARWTFLVFMNGDNNLESYVVHDLNELEEVGSGDGVNVVVQADRIPGYDNSDGDWQGTRRYYITADGDEEEVGSEVLEEMGELDMGDPQVLSDFLLWAAERYPAERTALILWNHGDSWTVAADGSAPPSISSDDSSESWMSVAQGELTAGLAPYVERYGRLDLLGFDACLMASWEVAHAVKDQADWMLASPISVGWEGYRYGPALARLRGEEEVAPEQLAAQMVDDMVAGGTEWGESAVDLAGIDRLSAALDQLAGVAMEDPAASEQLLACRDVARGCYRGWESWYLDIGDLTDRIEQDSDSEALRAAGEEVRQALDGAVLAVQGAGPYAWISGLTIFADTSNPWPLGLYRQGSWAAETRWDDWLTSQAAGGEVR